MPDLNLRTPDLLRQQHRMSLPEAKSDRDVSTQDQIREERGWCLGATTWIKQTPALQRNKQPNAMDTWHVRQWTKTERSAGADGIRW